MGRGKEKAKAKARPSFCDEDSEDILVAVPKASLKKKPRDRSPSLCDQDDFDLAGKRSNRKGTLTSMTSLRQR